MVLSTKTLVQFIVALFILVFIILACVKFLVLPAKLELSQKSIEAAEYAKELGGLRTQVADAKAAVLVDMATEERKRVRDYIDKNTVVLSDKMIASAANALVDASTEYKIPLPLLVGIAQATSNFNTTYMSNDSGHRGVLALHPKYYKKVEENVNLAEIGVAKAAEQLKALLDEHTSLYKALVNYFGDSKYSTDHIDNVFIAIANFTCYKKE